MTRVEQQAQRERRGDDAKVCLDAFYAAFVRRHNPDALAEQWLAMSPRARSADEVLKAKLVLPRISGAKDMVLMRKMIDAWGRATVERLIADFFGAAYLMRRVHDSNQDVGALWAVAPQLLVRAGIPDARTAANLDAAQKAMGRK